ncbi:hypothetical protein JCM8208_005127 [Rhodotorula glutinis]
MGLAPSRPAAPTHASPAALAAHFSLSPSSHWLSTEPTLATALASSTKNHTHTTDLLQHGWRARTKHTQSSSWTADPFDRANHDAVLAVDYPPASRSGDQFEMRVLGTKHEPAQTALLKYEVAFDPTFDFVKGGKLPGLSGTSSSSGHGRTLCVGGRHLDSCVSARLMWRPQGLGEVYAYVPTDAGFCEEGERRGDVACDVSWGTSLSRGSFRFERARWHTITQLVSLNDPPLANGLLHLYLDDHLVLSHSDILWRTSPNVTFDAVLFSTFFGGGDDSYNSPSSPSATSYFRRFEVYSSPNASSSPGRSIAHPIWGDPYPPSRRRARSISRSLVFVACLAVLGSPVLHWATS